MNTEDRVDIAFGFDVYAQEAQKSVIYPDGMRVVYPVLGLASEAGEVADKIKKSIRDNNGVLTWPQRHEVAKELGDCLWYLALTARDLGISFGRVACGNIEKIESRVERGVIEGSGDNR